MAGPQGAIIERKVIDLDAERRRRLNGPVVDLLRQEQLRGMLSLAERLELARRGRVASESALTAFRSGGPTPGPSSGEPRTGSAS